jgi:hypothetical protein
LAFSHSRSVTLNIGDYAPEICALTYPLLQSYARKIGADFYVIRESRFPDWPLVYEKLQIYDLARNGSDWNIYIDSDALVNPEMFDVTAVAPVTAIPRARATSRFTQIYADRGRYGYLGRFFAVLGVRGPRRRLEVQRPDATAVTERASTDPRAAA